MKVSELPVGARFFTRLTKREGRVLAFPSDEHGVIGVFVLFSDGEERLMHPNVEVNIDE